MDVAHFVLTRSCYAPDYPLDANCRRLELLRGICARSLAAQTCREWTWLVKVHPEDPLLEERRTILAALPIRAEAVPADRPEPDGDRDHAGDGGFWRRAVRSRLHEEHRQLVATTRIDDDDAFASDAIARVQRHLAPVETPIAWVLTNGWRLHAGQVEPMHHPRNQFPTLQTPAGDALRVVYEAHHGRMHEVAEAVEQIGGAPAWLWVRHDDAKSPGGRTRARHPLSSIRRDFEVDWNLLQ